MCIASALPVVSGIGIGKMLFGGKKKSAPAQQPVMSTMAQAQPGTSPSSFNPYGA